MVIVSTLRRYRRSIPFCNHSRELTFNKYTQDYLSSFILFFIDFSPVFALLDYPIELIINIFTIDIHRLRLVYDIFKEHFRFLTLPFSCFSSGSVCVFVVWLHYASWEKDNKRLAVVVSTGWCQKERERELFLSLRYFFLLLLFIHSFFFGINPPSHFLLTSISLSLSFSHTVNQSLCICIWLCTVIS